MIDARIDRSKKIIFANYSGSIRLNDISDFYSQLSAEFKNWEKLKLVQDEREAEFPETKQVLENAKSLVDILNSSFNSIKIAIVQDRPMETAYSYLFLANSSAKNYTIKVFSVEENAVKWISE